MNINIFVHMREIKLQKEQKNNNQNSGQQFLQGGEGDREQDWGSSAQVD